MVSSSTEAAYDFGVSAVNASYSLHTCFTNNTGLSERVSEARDEADIYLAPDVNHAHQVLFNCTCLRKIEHRAEMEDLCGGALLPGSNSEALLDTGKGRLRDYVVGGFPDGRPPAFPKHVCMSQTEITTSTRDADTDDGLLGMDPETEEEDAEVA